MNRTDRSRSWTCAAAVIAAAVIAACVPVAPAGYDDAPPTGAATSTTAAPTGGGASTCESACRHLASCGLAEHGACVNECVSDGYPEDALVYVEQASCEELAQAAAEEQAAIDAAARRGGGGGARTGALCAERGVDDCPTMTVCCRGRCQSPGVCHMPTH